ncbi:amidohydrolase family protein [Rhodanobacter aciditrophus]|uniref:Amidohydrolase family protein n=1 Tax=Rhodanobacter aciditrophus TaxID=1623218 RepID=A0ABW4B075_9GAMM
MKDSSGNPITGVDTHAHIFSTDLPLTRERRYAPSYNATVDEYLGHLEAHNLSHGVLVQPSFLGTDNDYIAAAIAKHPTKLRGIAVVDPAISDDELDALNEAGMVGIRLNLIQKPLEDYASPSWQSFFKKVAARNWSVEIQREIDDLADFLPSILESGVEVVVDHFAKTKQIIDPSIASHERFLNLLSQAPVWTKISAAYRCNANLENSIMSLNALRSAYGHSERLLWGSDWPHTQFEDRTGYQDQYEFMTRLLADSEERDTILILNPKQLFNF